jgi:hypothetical protein
MNKNVDNPKGATALLTKTDPNSHVLIVTGPIGISVKAGTTFADRTFDADTPVGAPDNGYEVGCDYAVAITAHAVKAVKLTGVPTDVTYLGGFHFAPGGNASARAGGDSTPAINPFSVWDMNFRPSCADPRGMALIEMPGKKFWADIYLLGVDHLKDGTSKFGATIADGDDPPEKVKGSGHFKKLDYETAVAVMTHHGKTLLGFEEFANAAYGVTEKSAHSGDPRKTGLDAERTSKFGLMQATGNMWVWGHDGDPDMPRASVFGGSWFNGGDAGSRYANVAYLWPEYSGDDLGARGRGDHLQLG